MPAGPPGGVHVESVCCRWYGVFIYDEPSTSHHNVWAVRAGDVPAVPEPETYALVLAGLALIARRHSKALTRKSELVR